jgi:hypothetical protein
MARCDSFPSKDSTILVVRCPEEWWSHIVPPIFDYMFLDFLYHILLVADMMPK